jgi:2-phospho-L-lactate guanylyltransferase
VTFAVLPIKRFSAAKQRLQRDDRADVMRGMADGVLRALDDSVIERVLVVTSDPGAAALAAAHGCEVVPEPGLLGHSGAATLGVERALALGATRVLLLPGDCPLLRGEDIDALLAAHREPGVVVLCDRHGTGTNGLLLEPPAAIAPAFGPGSRTRHERLAADAGVPCVVDERAAFAFDVDTLDDLAAIDDLRAA